MTHAASPHRPTAAAVIFDMDGVLIDSEELQFEAYSTVLAEFGVHITREEYGREWIARGGGSHYAVARYHLPISAGDIRARKDPVYYDILRARAKLMPGARAALERMGPQFAVALATNSSVTDTGFVLEHFALEPHFAAVVTRERYDRAKPAPDAFLTAASILHVPPSCCLVVEDTYRGVTAAHLAGMRSVAVPHEFTRDNDFSLATRMLGSLDELTVDLVREILASP